MFRVLFKVEGKSLLDLEWLLSGLWALFHGGHVDKDLFLLLCGEESVTGLSETCYHSEASCEARLPAKDPSAKEGHINCSMNCCLRHKSLEFCVLLLKEHSLKCTSPRH